jgi:hypothetical protein
LRYADLSGFDLDSPIFEGAIMPDNTSAKNKKP